MRVCALALLAPCTALPAYSSSAGAPHGPDSVGTPNVVVILLDETGTDFLSMYDEINPYQQDLPYDPTTTGSGDVPANGNGTSNLYISSPTLDSMAASGIKFTNAYAQPRCSPSRASLLSGVYPTNHGVGDILVPPTVQTPEPVGALTDFGDPGFDPQTLPELLHTGTTPYLSGVFGKWHLAMPTPDMSLLVGEPCYMGWPSIWERGGFDAWACVFNGLDNVPSPLPTGGYCAGFYNFYVHRGEGTSGVQEHEVDEYATCVQFGDALDWVNATSTTEPFFCLISPNAAHSPHHYLPPTGPPSGPCTDMVNTAEYEATVDYNAWTRFCASFEAIDTALGEFMVGMDDDRKSRTLFVVMGDNGTPEPVMETVQGRFSAEKSATNCIGEQFILGGNKRLGETYEFILNTGSWGDGRFKGTVYEKGVRVPLIVCGAGVADGGRTSEALVQVEDVFATVADVARKTPAGPLNGVSFGGILDNTVSDDDHPRDSIFSQVFNPTGHSGPETDLAKHEIGCSLKIDGSGRFKIVRDALQPTSTDLFYQLEDADGNDVDRFETNALDFTSSTWSTQYDLVGDEIDAILTEATSGTTCFAGTTFCDPIENSLSRVATLGMSGTTRVDCNDLKLSYTGTIPNQPAMFFYGAMALDPPGLLNDGRLCVCIVGSQPCGIFRLGDFTTGSDPDGSGLFTIDLDDLPGNGPISAGETWLFQLWYRDPANLSSNLSDGLELVFCP